MWSSNACNKEVAEINVPLSTLQGVRTEYRELEVKSKMVGSTLCRWREVPLEDTMWGMVEELDVCLEEY